MRQENNYQKFITKCGKGLLQIASGITKCVRFTKRGRLSLQSASGITKCDVIITLYNNWCNMGDILEIL